MKVDPFVTAALAGIALVLVGVVLQLGRVAAALEKCQ